MTNIAVLISCHNRKSKTLACLKALFASEVSKVVSLHVIMLDDNSTDGTSEAVISHYSAIEIIRGDGNLFWNGGMRIAFAAAMKKSFDFYLWLNDDTILYPSAISALLGVQDAMQAMTGKFGIAVGSTCDDDGRLTYGGKQQPSRFRPLYFETVQPSGQPIPCATMNGNCVLVSAKAADLLGNLDPSFIHTIGDIDYGLRARDAGLPVWVMPGFAGRCLHDHTVQGSYLDSTLSLRKRFEKVIAPKNFPPRTWFVFCWRHAGWFWPLVFLSPYLKTLIPPKAARNE